MHMPKAIFSLSCCKAIPSRHAFHRQMLNGFDLEWFRPLSRPSQLTRVVVPCTVDDTISGQPPDGIVTWDLSIIESFI